MILEDSDEDDDMEELLQLVGVLWIWVALPHVEEVTFAAKESWHIILID